MGKKILLLLFIISITFPAIAQVEKIVGKWYIIDEDFVKKSIVSIYKASDGLYEGIITSILTGDPDSLCSKCPGADKNKPFLGLVIIRKMREEKGNLVGGTILDPLQGKFYHSSISYDEKTATLKVRGSLDKWGLIGRNQKWARVEE